MVSIINNEHPVIASEPMLVKLNKAAVTSWTEIKLPDTNELVGHVIVGAFVIKQNAVGSTKMKYEPTTGLPIAAIAAVQNCYLNIQTDCGDTLINFPVEVLLHDGVTHGGLTYAKTIFPNGIKPTKSSIKIELSCLDADEEVLVIHWLLGETDNCCISNSANS